MCWQWQRTPIQAVRFIHRLISSSIDAPGWLVGHTLRMIFVAMSESASIISFLIPIVHAIILIPCKIPQSSVWRIEHVPRLRIYITCIRSDKSPIMITENTTTSRALHLLGMHRSSVLNCGCGCGCGRGCGHCDCGYCGYCDAHCGCCGVKFFFHTQYDKKKYTYYRTNKLLTNLKGTCNIFRMI